MEKDSGDWKPDPRLFELITLVHEAGKETVRISQLLERITERLLEAETVDEKKSIKEESRRVYAEFEIAFRRESGVRNELEKQIEIEEERKVNIAKNDKKGTKKKE